MDWTQNPWLVVGATTCLMGVIALLYASVGHAGASGYLAIMALLGVAPAVMKPSALVLNIVVASIAVLQYYRAGAFSWRLFAPLAVASIPFAYLGGYLTLPEHWYKPMIGMVLIYAVFYSYRRSYQEPPMVQNKVSPWALAAVGAVFGLLSGLTGVGGGIFLSPLLLRMNWAPVRVISGVAAMFILVNSISGLMGLLCHQPTFSPALIYWAIAVVLGGTLGAYLGSQFMGNAMIQRTLAVVLLVSGVKMMLA